MTEKQWASKITRICKQAGTFKPFFKETILQLAGILAIRDQAMEQYKLSGDSAIIKYTNKGGYANLKKNPALVVVNEQNQLALAYWRDLGLTPAGYKKLNGEGVTDRRSGVFEAALQEALK